MASESVSSSTSIRRKLGRGLGSLISAPVRVELPPPPQPQPERGPAQSAPLDRAAALPAVPHALGSARSADDAGDMGIRLLALDEIRPNPRQPRQHFDEDALNSLANSIKCSGLMQPIVVRPVTAAMPGTAGGFQLIAGERRWRAAQIAGLLRIPAVVRNLDDKSAAELALVENLQREDLNPLERAEAFARLIEEFGLTHQEVAERVGLNRTSVTNHLRLNELDEFSKDAVRAGRLSLGHAKVLLVITNNQARSGLAGLAVRNDWSVRELERRVKQQQQGGPGPGTGTGAAAPNKTPAAAMVPHVSDLQKRLSEHLGTKVHVRPGRNKGSGKLIIEFYTLDQFEGLMRRMKFDSD